MNEEPNFNPPADVESVARHPSVSRSEGDFAVSVDFDADATVNYALQQSRTPVVRRLRIVNRGKVAIPDLTVQIVSQPSFGWTIVLDGGLLMPGDERSWERMRLDLDPDWLGKVTESLVGRFLIEIRSGEEVIHEAIREVEVLAPDHWNGLRSLPELIAAFVQPNSRAVESLLVSAAERLAERGGVLNGYQAKSRNAVASQVQALFAAIQARGVHYSNPPASFESSGQKVRLPQRILDSGIATCLDTTLLLCACAEQAGLNSLVVLLDGHAACGIWLEESKFSDTVQDSHSHLKNRVDLEMILMVETTLLCSPGANFAAAVESGRRLLSDEGRFRCVIDIASCRAAEVRPLPFLDDGAIDTEAVARRWQRAEAAVRNDGGVEVDEGLDLTDFGDRKHNDKGGERLDRWKRNLLDLTLSNRLLSFRHTRATLPLLVPDLSAFEDALAAGENFSVLPLEGAGSGEPRLHEAHELKDEELGRVREGFARKSLHVPMTEGALFKSLTELYLAAKSSLEENGANTLYLALGFLRWRRGGDSDKAIEAPLILVPLTIDRKSVKEGFRIRRGEDELAFNTTLIEALTAEFGLKIPGVDPLPEDEKGIDVPKVLKLVRHAIADYKGWTVVEAAAVGIFSFSKFLMWKDLEKHSEELARNPLVGHLIRNDGSAPEFAGADRMVRAEELDLRYSPADTLAPLSSDSTQLAAVHSGAEGRTFVLEGPPGTGKSQTITNLIAQALGKRKTVLFVAEKRAALEVVHRRLKQVGLGEFVLELHSNKANKVGVLQQFEGALQAAGDLDRGQWESVCSELAEKRSELNRYVEVLHHKRAAGCSVWDGLNRIWALEGVPLVSLAVPETASVTEEALVGWRSALHELRRSWELVGDPVAHPFSDCWFEDRSRSREKEAETALRDLDSALGRLEDILGRVSVPFGLRSLEMDGASVAALSGFLDWLHGQTSAMPSSLLRSGASERAALIAEVVLEHAQANAASGECWYEPGDAARHAEWARRLREVDAANPVMRFFGNRKLVKELRGRIRFVGKLDRGRIEEAVAAAQRKEEADQRFVAVEAEGRELFGHAWGDPAEVMELASRAAAGGAAVGALQQAVADDGAVEVARRLAASDAGVEPRAGLSRWSTELRDAFDEASAKASKMETAMGLRQRYWSPDGGGFRLGVLRERVAAMRAAVPGFRAWAHWCGSRRRVESDAMLSAWLPDALKAGLSSGQLLDAFEKAFFTEWTDAVVESEPCLAGFFQRVHETSIEDFRNFDEEYRRLSARYVHARLAAEVPQVHAGMAQPGGGSEMGTLMREFQKQRRHLPVRRLLELIPNLMRRLKPCLLMSPLSVAQYLPAIGESYDIVVFDEASQIPPWDALGAFARGRTAVVVGDPKQLPPTGFFQKDLDADADDETLDLESILDECIAARLPRLRLGWHYRSRHESLITFSNHRYYRNSLLTFPSVDQALAVKHIEVPDAVYDKGRSRTNRKEAERVVEEIVSRLGDPSQSQRSLGVVTFSLAQQRLIEELLDKERSARPEIEAAFSEARLEPVFVKNLESVQGDERDVVIFSIGYGPDREGRVPTNFGPLNRNGGPRRLNVAITRAREEVVVVSALLPEHIDLTRTNAAGVGDLRGFLDFARRGPVALADLDRRLGIGEHDSPFEEQVAEALRERGYTLHPQVGCSGYRIDLGVVHPDLPGAYLVGIECDGAQYHSSRNARDRDKLRQSVLEGLGWIIVRVWSTEWWRDRDGQVERLVERIEQARRTYDERRAARQECATGSSKPEEPVAAAAGENPISGNAGALWVPPAAPPKPPAANVYRAHRFAEAEGVPERFFDASETPAIQRAVEAVIASEAPVSEALLTARVRGQWGLKSSGSRIAERVRSVASSMEIPTVKHGDAVFYWPRGADPRKWSDFRVAGEDSLDQRNAEDLPPEEIAAAAHAVLKSHVSLTQEGLVTETARLFGYKRTGRKLQEVIAAGVALLLERGVAQEER